MAVDSRWPLWLELEFFRYIKDNIRTCCPQYTKNKLFYDDKCNAALQKFADEVKEKHNFVKSLKQMKTKFKTKLDAIRQEVRDKQLDTITRTGHGSPTSTVASNVDDEDNENVQLKELNQILAFILEHLGASAFPTNPLNICSKATVNSDTEPQGIVNLNIFPAATTCGPPAPPARTLRQQFGVAAQHRTQNQLALPTRPPLVQQFSVAAEPSTTQNQLVLQARTPLVQQFKDHIVELMVHQKEVMARQNKMLEMEEKAANIKLSYWEKKAKE